MQKIEYKESPSPHVIIENFLPIKAARECLEEAQALEPVYEEATVHKETGTYDGCEECVANDTLITSMVRSNKVVYLDTFFKHRRYKSTLLNCLKTAITTHSFMETMSKLPNMFPIATQTTNMETILSSYGKCDFYGWHRDSGPEFGNWRILPLVLHLNTEPQEYVGGELILTGETIQDQLAYTPKHNRAIIFQSNQCLHAVNETNHEGDFKDSRFSINLWLGFPTGVPGDPEYRYKE